jgi:hypothetical protein
MRNKTAGMLFGAGLGAGVVWLISRAAKDDNERIMILKTRPDGSPGIEMLPEDVVVRSGKKLVWWVANLSDSDVVVSIRNWRNSAGQPKAPAVSADPDDIELDDDPQHGLSRKVRKGKVKKIRSKARLPAGITEEVRYDVYLDNDLGADPIVKLVL